MLNIGYFANRYINKGEELTIDYSYPWVQSADEGAMKCCCGAKNCRGRMR